jgi:hypothetical protein
VIIITQHPPLLISPDSSQPHTAIILSHSVANNMFSWCMTSRVKDN